MPLFFAAFSTETPRSTLEVNVHQNFVGKGVFIRQTVNISNALLMLL